MKFRVRCVKTGKSATESSSVDGAERNAEREGFVKIDGKWYFKKELADDKAGN